MNFAAIDIGTNAIRLLLAKVFESSGRPFFRKEALVRIPLRLGEDAFALGHISDEKIARLIATMTGFKHLIQGYPAYDYMAVATSAMREAANGSEVARVVRDRSGIDFEIITGQKEAEIIYANHIEERLTPDVNYVYVDVGGGSTEITILTGRKHVDTGSFRIGSVRILEGGVAPDAWLEMKQWVKAKTMGYQPIVGIGSGGNINKIFKMSRIKEGKPIGYKRIRKIYKYVASFGLEERITVLGLRPDRADVIIPGAEIYMSVMKWARARQMYVPQFGLSDGLVHIMYERHRAGRHAHDLRKH